MHAAGAADGALHNCSAPSARDRGSAHSDGRKIFLSTTQGLMSSLWHPRCSLLPVTIQSQFKSIQAQICSASVGRRHVILRQKWSNIVDRSNVLYPVMGITRKAVKRVSHCLGRWQAWYMN